MKETIIKIVIFLLMLINSFYFIFFLMSFKKIMHTDTGFTNKKNYLINFIIFLSCIA